MVRGHLVSHVTKAMQLYRDLASLARDCSLLIASLAKGNGIITRTLAYMLTIEIANRAEYMSTTNITSALIEAGYKHLSIVPNTTAVLWAIRKIRAAEGTVMLMSIDGI